MKVFLDTNVVIDFLVHRDPFFGNAAIIFQMADDGLIDLFVSSLTFVNVAYILRKAFGKDRIWSSLQSLADICEISGIGGQEIADAIERRSFDFEDCVQFLSSQTVDADIIITRDPKGFGDLDAATMSPQEFVSACQR